MKPISLGAIFLVAMFALANTLPAQTYYLQSFPAAPYPFDPYDGMESITVLDASNHIYLVEDSAEDREMLQGLNRMSALDAPFPGGGGGTNGYYFESFEYEVPTNGLWLEITNVANGLAYFNLHNASNYVYEILSKTDLAATTWNIETEVFPTDTNCMPFIVSQLERTNLFIWARDWTGITSNGNETPEWWFYYFFGRVDLLDTNLDTVGNMLLNDYQNGFDPNLITFSLQFTNHDLNASPAYGTVTIQGGVPSYIAILVNDTNQAGADWQPYTGANIIVPLTSGDGLYEVQVGLKGLPPDAVASWLATELTLNTVAPELTVTNPVDGTVAVPLIQLQGYVGVSLSKLTYDVSNAVGVITNQPGYWQPVYYDTNLLAFTTNTFQCYDVRLTNGLNTITVHATDMAGNTSTTNISYTLDYSGDTMPPMLSLLWPTNGTSIAGSTFTLQAQMDDATATVTANINSNTVTGLVERNGTVWFNHLPLESGTNVVIITATDAAGNISTTNLSVIKGDVTVTIDPVSSDQLNQSSVTVTGTISDPTDKVTVNDVSADMDEGGNWTAHNVPVSPTGTANLNVQIKRFGRQSADLTKDLSAATGHGYVDELYGT